MGNAHIKEEILLTSAMDELLVKGITDAASVRTLQKCKEALEHTKDIAVCSIRARKPAVRITLDKCYAGDNEEIADFRKKAESARTFTAFTDQLKRLESIEKAAREKLYSRCILSKGDSHIISKSDFEDFYKSDFGKYKDKWEETLEEIRAIYGVEMLGFKNRVSQIIHSTPYSPETKKSLEARLKRVCTLEEDAYVSKLTLELDSEFSPDAFEDEEMIAAVTTATLNRTRRDMADLIGGLISAAYESVCAYLLQVGVSEKDTTLGLVSSKNKLRKAATQVDTGNVFHFEPVAELVERMREMAEIEDTLDARYALLELLSEIWKLGLKYDLDLDEKKLPNAEGIRITPTILEEGV